MSNENNRELLEMAAKAAGLGVWLKHDDRPWNPLEDDGDALRLAVKLKLRLGVDNNWAWARAQNPKMEPYTQESSGIDPDGATRRAIVRAAAEIGKAMK